MQIRFTPVDHPVIGDFIELERERLFPLHQDFLDEFGGNFAEMQPRFAQRHDPNRLIPAERFEQLLGIDVAHDTHPISQWGIAIDMLRDRSLRSTLTEADRQALLFAELTHDFGEAVAKKDIAYGDKTEETEKEELRGWDYAVNKITSGTRLEEYLMNDVRPIIFDSAHPLHRIFDVSEGVGYARTAIRAAHVLDSVPDLKFHERETLLSIATDVRRRKASLPQEAEDIGCAKRLAQNTQWIRIGRIIETEQVAV
jgi:hypothetical protein